LSPLFIVLSASVPRGTPCFRRVIARGFVLAVVIVRVLIPLGFLLGSITPLGLIRIIAAILRIKAILVLAAGSGGIAVGTPGPLALLPGNAI
jgi:hypothetical protein